MDNHHSLFFKLLAIGSSMHTYHHWWICSHLVWYNFDSFNLVLFIGLPCKFPNCFKKTEMVIMINQLNIMPFVFSHIWYIFFVQVQLRQKYYTHPKTGVQTHNPPIITVHFMSLRCLSLPPGHQGRRLPQDMSYLIILDIWGDFKCTSSLLAWCSGFLRPLTMVSQKHEMYCLWSKGHGFELWSGRTWLLQQTTTFCLSRTWTKQTISV